MQKVRINAAVDILALLSGIPIVISGLVLFYAWGTWPLDRGGLQGGRNPLYITEMFGLTHEQWVMIHDITSVIFILLVLIHLILHWRFMRNIAKHLRGTAKTECVEE